MPSCRSIFLKMNTNSDDSDEVVILDSESGGSSISRRDVDPPQPEAIINTDTIYNSSGGYRRMVSTGRGFIPCDCRLLIVSGIEVVAECGCNLTFGLEDAEFDSTGPPASDAGVDIRVGTGSIPGGLDPKSPLQASAECDNCNFNSMPGPSSSSSKKRDTGKSRKKNSDTIPPDSDQPACGGSDAVEASGHAAEVRVLPNRLVKKTPFSTESYRLSDESPRTGICFVDIDTAYEIGALKVQIEDGVLSKNVCAALNEMLNSDEAVRQIKEMFTPAALKAGGNAKFGKSSNAGKKFNDGLFATRNTQPGEVIAMYGGFCVDFSEKKGEDESIASDRKIVLDVSITQPNGEVLSYNCMLIGWECPNISDRFPLVNGHIMNHSCIPNCEMVMRPLTFERDGFKFEILTPVFKVCDDVPGGVAKNQEFTFDYGIEMCKLSPFFRNEYQDLIARAQTMGNSKQKSAVLKKVPKSIDAQELELFMEGYTGIDCSCPECDFAQNFDPPFSRSVLNLGPNDTKTDGLRQLLNYGNIPVSPASSRKSKSRVKGTPTARSKRDSGGECSSGVSVRSTSSVSSGLTSARAKHGGSGSADSALASSDTSVLFAEASASGVTGSTEKTGKIGKTGKTGKTGKAVVSPEAVGAQKRTNRSPEEAVKSPTKRRGANHDGGGSSSGAVAAVSPVTSQAAGARARINRDDSDGSSGDMAVSPGPATSQAAGARARVNHGVCARPGGLRPGYTRHSGKYMPYALAVFSNPAKSYQSNKDEWISERSAHDRAQKEVSSKPMSWSDAARRLLLAGPSPADPVSKANAFLHPPPPVPDDD